MMTLSPIRDCTRRLFGSTRLEALIPLEDNPMVNAKPDSLDTPANSDRRRGIRTELATIGLYTSGYALAHALMQLARFVFTPAGH